MLFQYAEVLRRLKLANAELAAQCEREQKLACIRQKQNTLLVLAHTEKLRVN
jgi:hypothetical protein